MELIWSTPRILCKFCAFCFLECIPNSGGTFYRDMCQSKVGMLLFEEGGMDVRQKGSRCLC